MKKIIIDKIKVNIKFPANPESSVKAIGIVTLGPIKIKGFKILGSDYINRHGDALWITPPANRGSDGRFYDAVYTEDKNLWNEIEDEIYKEYKRRRGKRNSNIPIIEEDGKRN